MSIHLKNVRAAVASQILTISGMHLSRLPPAYFGRQQNTLAHKSFVVGIESVEDTGERQRRSHDLYVRTTVEVQFAYRLRPKDIYPTDYDLSLDLEGDVIAAVMGTYSGIQNEISIRFARSSREISDSIEYQITTLTFFVTHNLSS
jgi:hypothetical protein